ncbi:uncharacterized protein MYCFIDRAFT_170044 [Pseudocercospora fijiensis CIRAD86]|uniref:Heterokaryon incompatibility domain-containing protein n=1 Tax=Pseudocercospora fijiensis (strain CIRAD86) TaxID=383855 RepID=N1Q9F5_PSEFD|nr:uncharacterized protein MYCFIDRAFT_170044 [Pseudocercospora fijiensis CIRAD86]EME88426.1 hypothetical protein MYCFIDRAFT_170044 [Pseudocercospora fijiensis CIRAD86]
MVAVLGCDRGWGFGGALNAADGELRSGNFNFNFRHDALRSFPSSDPHSHQPPATSHTRWSPPAPPQKDCIHVSIRVFHMPITMFLPTLSSLRPSWMSHACQRIAHPQPGLWPSWMADQRDAQNGLPYRPQLRQGTQSTYLKDVYRPLARGSIRLIELHGLGDDGRLLAPDAKPKYATISYTWNPKNRITYGKYDVASKHIILDGFRTRVPDKAATILRLMFAHRRRRVWIDAICINQSDAAEKASQVQMMGDIYRFANEVAIMLGPPSDLTDHFIDSLHDTESALKECEEGPRKLNAGYDALRENMYWTRLDVTDVFRRRTIYGNLRHQALTPSVPSGIRHVMDPDTWTHTPSTRAWTLQEISLATSANIFCGSRVVDFQSYYNFRERVETDVQSKAFAVVDKTAVGFLADAVKGGRRFNADIAEERYQTGLIIEGSGIGFLELMRRTRLWHNCLAPRDKLYSRLALAHDARTLVPSVDYKSTTESVFKSFAARCIFSTGTLEVITFANKTKMTLPTWVPDWSSPSKDWQSRKTALVEAIQTLPWTDNPELRVSADDTTLTVRGMVLETITASYAAVLRYYITYFSPYHVPRDAYSWSEIPRKGDHICALQGCNSLVFSRKVQTHYIIVGRFVAWQEMLELKSAHMRHLNSSPAKSWFSKYDDIPHNFTPSTAIISLGLLPRLALPLLKSSFTPYYECSKCGYRIASRHCGEYHFERFRIGTVAGLSPDIYSYSDLMTATLL